MTFNVEGQLIEWRGPAPFYFVVTTPKVSAEISKVSKTLTYGWGAIPVHITIGDLTVKTSLIPRDGNYYIPIKNALRLPLNLTVGSAVKLRLDL